jgi:hypothetical protein
MCLNSSVYSGVKPERGSDEIFLTLGRLVLIADVPILIL